MAGRATPAAAAGVSPAPAAASPPAQPAGTPAPATFDREQYSRSSAKASAPRAVRIGGDVTGFLLALVVWGWVVLPFLGTPLSPAGGVQGVKDVWRAKFLNKAPDGSWLP